jgi:altronate dehydratase large subunit
MTELTGYARPGRRPGIRDNLLVLPSVICSTLVSRRIADAVGAVTITHQDGCGHIGDDVEHTRVAYAGIANNPNIAASLLVSLGCETVQGSVAAREIADSGAVVEFLRIQDMGAAAAEVEGARIASEMIDAVRTERVAIDEGDLTVGVHVARNSAAARAFVELLAARGVSVFVAGPSAERFLATRGDAGAWARLGHGETAGPGLSVFTGDAMGSQHLAALAIGGAQMIVSFPDDAQPPASFPICPVVSVAGTSRLHAALAKDFDVMEQADGATSAAALWSLVCDVVRGETTVGERAGHRDFSLPRLRRTM